ncbi:mediator of DNA damage checkpoint protein 1 isoform X2 [Lepus europaeus]|uniref:mediator of DNA damage checkpoint protein 1 isoform X2 n=1 Tax=Lepus europaeus TaxID=9983 RepID=UPI002B49A75E|nr:mediator of DNA damage checkpoint protein 1 isoform X2 [Lepus europaeus]
MEDTQAIILETEDEEDTEQSNHIAGGGLEPVGRLRVFSSTHGPEKDFPLYLGKNVVGRMPDCSVALQSPSISKQHAVIEILAQGKAPLLHDCGSLNGTQILRPPKVLKPGVSHCLKDRQLILFADLLCQYHRLDIPLPCAPQGPLTIEETPRVQGEAQPQRLQLAEDSEEELDSKRCMMQDSRIASPSLATVVPESDEEGLSPALGGPAPSFGFRLDSDTDEEEGQHPVAEEASSAARRDTTTGAKLPEANGITAFTPAMKETHNGTEVQGKASNRLAPDGEILERNQAPEDTDADNDSRLPGRPTAGHLERVQPSGFMDSDTDVEEEQIPATPAVVPVKKRQIFRGVGPQGSGALGLQHVQESQARGDTDVEEDKAPLAVPLVRSHAPMVINSDTDDEEEISAALTLARLKESPAVIWNRDGDVEAGRAPPEVPLQQNQTTSGRDSDTDVEEEGLPADRTVPNGHADKDGAIVTAQSKMGPPTPNDGDTDVEAGTSSPGIHLKRSQASAPVAINTELEEEVSPGLAAVHLQKHQVPVLGTDQTEVEAEGGPAELPVLPPEGVQPSLAGDCETGTEEGTSLAASVVADVREGQLPADGDAGIDHTTAEQERALQLEAQGRSPMAQVEQDLLPVSSSNVTDLVVDTGTPGRTTQSQREGAQSPTGKQRELYMGGTEDLEEDSDDFEDVALQATQCFVDRDNQSVEDQNLEDEPTQAFLLNPPPEPASSSCSFQSSGTMDVSWELMATQPFCSTASDTSETQPIEANGFCPSPSRAIPQDQRAESLLHTEPLCQGRAMQTMEKDMGTPKETADRVTLERRPFERETNKLPPEGEKAATVGRGQFTRDGEQALAGDTGNQESDKREESASPEREQESLEVAMETSTEVPEKEIEKQTPAGEVSEREAERPKPEKECEPARLEVTLIRGPQREETEGGSQDQREQASRPRPQPGLGAGDLQGIDSVPVAFESQSGGGRGASESPRRQLRGHLNCKMSPDEKTSRGDPESPDACLPEASTPPPTPLISQSQKHPAPQPLLPPSPPSVEPPILRTGQNGSQEAPEIPLSSELESEVRPQKSSPVSSAILEPHPPTPTEQSVTPKLPSRATRGRTHRSYDKTPKPVESTAPDLQPSTSTERPVTTKPTSQATRGRTRRASAKTPEPVEPPVSTDQSVTPKPSTRATRGRTCRASAKTPEPVEPPVPTEQPVTPKPAFRATRGRTCRASAKTPEPVGPPVPTEQPVTPKPAFRATRGRTCRASAKTPEPIGPPVPTEQPVTPKPSTGATLGKTRRSSEPVEPIVPEILQLSTPTEHPVTPRPTPQVTWGRTRRSSATSPEPVGPTAPDLEPPLSADQPVTPKPTCRVTRGREHQSSARTPEPVEPPVSTEQPVTPKPSTRATRGRTCRASAKTPEPVEPPVPTEQPVIPKPAFRATRGRTCRASAKTPEPVEPPVPTEQPVTPKPAFRATRGRTCRASAKTPEPIGPPVPTEQPVTPKPSTGATLGKTRRSSEPVEPIVPEILQLSTPTEHPVTPRPTPQVTWGRTRRSSATSPEPVGPTAPDLEPPLSADQPVTPKPTSRVTRGRKHQSSVKTPEQVEPTVPDLEPLTPTEQPVTPRPTSRATRGRTLRSSIKTPEPVEPTAANLEPPTTVEQPVTPKAIAQSDQSGTLRSSTLNAVPVPAPSEFQSTVSTEQPTLAPIPQASNSRGQRARRKHSSPIAPIIYKPCSALPEPKSQLSSNQRQGAVRAAESLGTIPEPAFPQLLGVPTHAPQIQKVEAAGISGVIQETPKTSPSHKRSSAPMDSPPLQKRPRRGEVSQKTVFPKEEEEDMVVPVPGKRKRDQAEEKPKGIPSCSRRRTKPHQQSAAPKVLFTGVLDVRGEQAVLALGGSLASSVAEASHLVTDRICRTVKFLCALGRGIPILSLDWLYQSRKAGCFLPPDEYVVTDPEQEKNFGFRLRDALSRARERKLLEGYEIHVTPGVQPPPPQMREIISCCGGTILPSMPRSYKPQRVVITCPQDFPRCSGPLRLGVPLLSSEFLLTGVLKQEATPEAFVFSTLELPST